VAPFTRTPWKPRSLTARSSSTAAASGTSIGRWRSRGSARVARRPRPGRRCRRGQDRCFLTRDEVGAGAGNREHLHSDAAGVHVGDAGLAEVSQFSAPAASLCRLLSVAGPAPTSSRSERHRSCPRLQRRPGRGLRPPPARYRASPTADACPGRRAVELERAVKDLGFHGVLVNGATDGRFSTTRLRAYPAMAEAWICRFTFTLEFPPNPSAPPTTTTCRQLQLHPRAVRLGLARRHRHPHPAPGP